MTTILGKEVGPIGFGLMAIDALKAALNNGLTLWNGGEFYGTPEYNSMTLLKAYFTKYPEDADKVTLVVKGGTSLVTSKPDGSPENIRRSLDAIIDQLGGTKKLDLFNCARRDPNVPLEVTFGVIQKEYVDTGKLGGIALSECREETIHEAVKHAKIDLVEIELSLFTPDVLTNGVAAACAKYDIPMLGYSPVGKGMLAGRFKDPSNTKELGMLASFPRFQGEAFEHNYKLVTQVEAIAKEKGCTSAQIAISWVQNLGDKPELPAIIPIPGATTVARVEENSKLIKLTAEEMKKLDDLAANFETVGARYPAHVPINT
ncbi:Pyridoxal reductase [Cladobotryum mycophilum]|uniref:Pyridoxal reductase n=1 Tax=Cladobotryum mycophilum TaxID=491253 RepID=A0ABR0SEK6_9HYPO